VRTVELRVAAARRPSARALRELLALQASDWAFLESRRSAGDYPRRRSDGHFAALQRALDGDDDGPAVRGLAPELHGWG
jgi:1,4-alpha-glucan branching enzyme